MELSKAKTALFASLNQKKFREKHNLFLVEGSKNVLDSLEAFEVVAVVADEKWWSKQTLLRSGLGDKAITASMHQIEKISSLSTASDVVAIFKIPSLSKASAEDLVDTAGLNLILDGVRDPGNMGTIIRTAHWFGLHTIFVSKDCVDLYNPKTIAATMGSLGKVEIVECDIRQLILSFPQLPVYGTLLNGVNIYTSPLSAAGFIIMGNEGTGISDPIRELVTNPLLIPPYDQTFHPESLNVGIATAVTLSQFRSREA